MAFSDLLAAADRAALTHLGGTVRYAPELGEPVDVLGIFDAAYVRADIGTPGVSTCGPAVFFRLSDLPTDPTKDDPLITVGGVVYRRKEAHRDGQGGVVLLLRRA